MLHEMRVQTENFEGKHLASRIFFDRKNWNSGIFAEIGEDVGRECRDKRKLLSIFVAVCSTVSPALVFLFFKINQSEVWKTSMLLLFEVVPWKAPSKLYFPAPRNDSGLIKPFRLDLFRSDTGAANCHAFFS